jgi:hypothetical protein
VKEFAQLDKRGDAFRYSKSKKRAIITLPADRYDLANLQKVMEAVDNFFSGCDGWLDSLSSAEPDDY